MHSGTQASDAKDKTSAPELEGKSPVSASYKKHRGAGNYAAAYFSMWPGVLLGGLVGGVSRFVVEFVRNIGSLIDGIPYGFYYGAKAALTGEWTEARKGFSTSGHGLAGYLFAIPISIISLISTFGLERSKQDFTTTMTKSAYFLGAPMALVGAIVGGVSRVLIESVLEIGPAMIHGYRSAFPFKSADSTNNEPIAQSEDARRTAAAVAMRPSLKAAVGTFEWYEVHKYLFTGVFFSIGKVLGYGTRVVMTISDSIRQFIIGSAIGLYRGAIAGADYAPSQMTQYRTEAAPKSTFWLGGYWLFGGLTFFVTAVLRTVRDALVGLVRGIGLGLKNGALNRFAAYRKEDELIKHVKFHAARIGFIPYYVFTLVGGAMRSVADVVAGVLLWGVYSADAGFSLNTAGLFELASNIKKYRSYASYIVSPIVIPGLIAGCVLRQVANVIRGLFEGLYYGAKMGFNLSKDEIKKHIKESWTAENATSLLLFPFTAFVGGCAGLVARGVAELAKVQWGEVFTTFFGGLFGGLGYVIGYLFNKGVLDVFRSLKNIFQPFADLPQGRVFDWRSFIPSVLKVIATAAAAVLTVMSAGSLAPFVWPGLVVLNSAISAAWERSVDPMLIAESVMEPMTKFANNGQGRSKFLVALTRHHEELKGVYKEVTKGVTEVNEKGYTEKQTSVNYRFYRDMLMTSSAENGLTHMLECLRDGRIQYDKDEQVDSSAATFNTILTDGKKLGKSKFGFFNSGSDFTLKGGDTQRKYDYTYNAKEDRLHIKALGVGATSEKYDDVDLRKSGLAPTAAAQAAQAPVQAVF